MVIIIINAISKISTYNDFNSGRKSIQDDPHWFSIESQKMWKNYVNW